ncbi:tyrosine-type recombinase/integrase [Mycobacteroides abscessus]|uniref:tyrosine-type recombinase/integrase n=1 Tax=Mycobacteroides abscessus TaxID=36809 RepID=UPI0005E8A834|nr:tyrosine-type recombinase/integrase [Mycobacteroides abscessus]CPW71740.1 Integrase [Mycobacteroides abscessus]SKF62133.1 Integrase [Mycobacteroides abscessus subsp. bolletii]SKH91489.1 Integrase [Mycobacteroides abscessus subsp. bolletii]
MSDSQGSEKVKDALDTINHLPESMRLPTLLIVFCQLRVGEVLALSREDVVDSEAGATLIARWSVVENVSGIDFRPAKHPSIEIHVPAPLTAKLREHLAGCGPAPDDLLFLKPDGEPWTAGEFSRSFQMALFEAGIPAVSLHAFRHIALG